MVLETIRLAAEALGRNALRSALTALGIMIGIGAVIGMIAIGQGASAKVRAEIARLGAELLTLGIGQHRRGGQGAAVAARPFDYADVEAIRREIRGLRHVAPLSIRQGRASAGGRNWNVRIAGTENAYFLANGWPLAAGRLYSDFETYNGKPVCVIGAGVRQRLFKDGLGIGETLRLGGVACSVIGVLKEQGQTAAADSADAIVAVPFDLFQRRIQGASDVQAIVMAAYPSSDMARLMRSLQGLMRERRGLGVTVDNDFSLTDMRQVAQSMTAATQTLALFLGAIAAVSLLVGGIGIMNIMLVSVTERTHEIGVRLTIGALPSQVRYQFLCEAILLAFAGGVLGIVAGLSAAAIAAPALAIPFILDPSVVLVSVIVSIGIGIVFGYVPATRAAGLDPVEALRRN